MRHISSDKLGGGYAVIAALLIAVAGLYGCGSSETEESVEESVSTSGAAPLGSEGDETVSASGARPLGEGEAGNGKKGKKDRDAPSTPAGLRGSAASPSRINLNWTASTDNVGVTGYRVYRNGVLLVTLGNVIVHQDNGLTASATYSYTVQAFDAAGNASAQSTAAIVTTPAAPDTVAPSAPTSLAATAVSASRINLTWSASTDNVAVTGYRVFRDGALLLTLGNVTAHQDSSLIAGTTYVYTVRAIDAAGNFSSHSAVASATTSSGLDTTPPTIPANLVGNAISPTQIDLGWSASTDNDAVANYRLYRNGTLAATLTSTTYQDTGRSPSTAYSYRVDAIDATGNVSGLSAAVPVSTPSAPDTAAPTPPTGLGASVVSDTKIDLNWSASTDNVAVTGYQVIRSGSLLTTLGNVTTFQDTGLDPVTAYTYRVRALDAAGNMSPQSNAASATTQATPDTIAPTTPAGLAATAVSDTKIDLSWAASTDNVAVTGYRVYRNNIFLTTLGNVTTYQSNGLAPATTYTYNVDATDAAGNASGASSAASAATLAVNTATLTWDAVTAPGLSGYRVYYGTAPGVYSQALGNGINVGNVTTYVVTGLARGTRYYFAVTAFGTTESSYSNEVFKDIP
jgi:chitodextrinase